LANLLGLHCRGATEVPQENRLRTLITQEMRVFHGKSGKLYENFYRALCIVGIFIPN
jgi:hypothetical protein